MVHAPPGHGLQGTVVVVDVLVEVVDVEVLVDVEVEVGVEVEVDVDVEVEVVEVEVVQLKLQPLVPGVFSSQLEGAPQAYSHCPSPPVAPVSPLPLV